MPVTIEKLGEQIGAVVSGVDISSPIDEETLSLLRRAFYSHSVLVFRDQEISNEQHIAFSGGFGPLEMTIANDPVGDGGPIGVICNVDESGDIIPPDDKRMLNQKGNTMWHSDGAFRRVPLRGSLLSAKEVPPQGGETEYASLRAAYAPSPLRELLEWAKQPQFVYRHEWQLHDLVMWDNVSCLHRGRPWNGWNHRRVMHRTTLSGDALVPR